MKKMKKLFAVILSLAMVLGMSLSAFAANGEKPNSTNTATATVKNVEPGAELIAYRIVEPTYNDNGFTGYQRANGITETMLKDYLNPTASEITSIAKNTAWLNDSKTVKVENWTEGTTTIGDDGKEVAEYTASLGAGYWIVVVTGSDRQVVYNPMLVGIYYDPEGSGDNNTLVDGEVNAYNNWTLVPTDAYAKHSEPTLTKTIVDSDGNDHGNDVANEGTVKFNISTGIPAYSEGYEEVEVGISDELSEGLTLVQNSIKVNVGDNENVQAGEDTYTLSTSEKGFSIDFVSDYALENQGKNVVITYEATLEVVYDESGVPKNVNFNPNTNKATLTYTNDPQNKNNKGKKDDETYTYTFGIDTELGGNGEYKTGELFKVDENTTEVGNIETTKTVSNPLKDATFALTKASLDENGYPKKNNKDEYEKDGDPIATSTSLEDGKIVFDGLDAGTYILEETVAPSGYSLEGIQHLVVISAEYNDAGNAEGYPVGTLKSYTITIDGKVTSTYTATYTKDSDGKIDITADHTGENESLIKNTKLSSLPSTGGIGTTIFTIGGCIIMIVAAGLFFASRRKSSAK